VPFVRKEFQSFGESCLKALRAKFSGALENLHEIASLQGSATEFAQQRLLPEPIWQFVSLRRSREIDRELWSFVGRRFLS
jgi:hypothetical protein